MSLIAGSFATRIETLILTQGVLYGIGELVLYYPVISMLNEWFVQKRWLAYGILCCATGVTGIAMPFIIELLLKNYGYSITLRAISIGLVVLTGPMLPLLKGRLPASQQSAAQKTDRSFLRKPLFFLYTTSNLCQAIGYFFPSLYLPSYASSLGLSPATGALLLALFSMAQVGGQLTFGFLSDNRLPALASVAVPLPCDICDSGFYTMGIFTLIATTDDILNHLRFLWSRLRRIVGSNGYSLE